MKFASLQSLYLVWATPVLFLFFIYGMRKRKRILKRYATPRGLESISPEADNSRRWAKNILMLACVFFLAVAIAGPQYGFKWEEIEQKGVDIVLAVDCSKSMLARDIQPTRLDRAKREILDLISILKGDRVGLVAFAGTAFLQCPLTLDYGGFHIFIDVLSPDFLPVGGTNLAGALETALSAFDPESNTEKAIILITDGESTAGDPMEAAKAVSRSGAKLFCIGVGSPDGVPAPDDKGGFLKDAAGSIVLTKLDEDTLKRAALATGGAYVRSMAGDMDLDIIYTREIRGKMQAETLSAGKRKIWENRYQLALFLAIAAFSLELAISSARPRKPGLVVAALLISCLLFAPPDLRAEGVYEKMQKGLEAYRAQDFDKAKEYFIEAQLDEPENPDIAFNLGASYYKTGDYKAAERNFAQALNWQSREMKANSLYNLGNAFFRQQNLEKALESYETALKIDPDDKEAAANSAWTKKLLEQQQKQQSDSNGGDGQKGEDAARRDRSGEGEKRENDSEQNPSAENDDRDSAGQPQNGRDSDGNGENSREDVRQGESDGNQEEQDSAKAQTSAEPEGGKENEKADAIGKQHAEAMLNRLEDKPGRALIPAYGKSRVEKDW